MADYGVRITLAASSPLPTMNDFPFTSGVAQFSSGEAVAGWTSGLLLDSPSPLGEQVDISQGGNYASIDDFDCTLLATWWPSFELVGASLYGALVEVGTITFGTFTHRWSGTVSDISWQGAELRVSAESLITQRHRVLPSRILTRQEFPALPADAEGSPVPIVYGAVERMKPVSLLADRDYLTAMNIYAGGATTPIERSTTFIADSSGASPATLTVVSFVYFIGAVDAASPDLDFDDAVWWQETEGTVYVEIFSGTGSGQVRRITAYGTSGSNTIDGNLVRWIPCTLASPLDTLPDQTSGIRFYLQPTAAVLAIADEAATESVVAEVDGKPYPIGFAPGTMEDVVTADVSAEFVAGEDYSAIFYKRPSSTFGISALSDGLTASSGFAASIMPVQSASVTEAVYDYLCRGKILVNDLPDSVVSESPSVAVMFAAATPADGLFEVVLYAQLWDGSVERVQEFEYVNVFSEDRSTYSSAILPDGTPGNYSSWAIPVTLAKPMASYSELQFTVAYRSGIADNLSLSTAITWTNGGTSVVVSYDPTLYGIAIGDMARPYTDAVVPSTLSDVFMYGERSGLDAFGGDSSLWREITGITSIGSGQWRIDLDAAISIATGSYGTILVSASVFASVTMYECGMAFAFGAIPQDAQFLASTSSGRTYGAHWTTLPAGVSYGDPITEARDMARDMMIRDLGLSYTDVLGYYDLPDATASAVLDQQEDSAKTLARMCQEFNWIGAHDLAGRETATAWLERLYTTDSDYTVTTADMVEGSISGVDATSLDDVVTLPRVSWSSTQADGFREQGTVTDCTVDPDDLDSSNYLRTITGFGDFATALEAYQILHEAWKRSGVRRPGTFEYRYGGNPTDLLFPARMEWAASRKDILTFRVNELHPSSAAYCGQRIAVSHKRYTGGGTVYGTLVAIYWYPGQGQSQLTVMLDPVEFAVTEGLLIDTLDPTATAEQYIDVRDGVTTQYIDTLG